MFPFFLIGYYCEKIISKVSAKLGIVIATVAGAIFPIFMYFFHPEYSMYLLEAFDITKIFYYVKAYAIRFMVGITGCALISVVLWIIWRRLQKRAVSNRLVFIGTLTMELYILHTFFVSYLIHWLFDGLGLHAFFCMHTHFTNFVIAPVITIGVILVCTGIIQIINKIPVLSTIMFGLKNIKQEK